MAFNLGKTPSPGFGSTGGFGGASPFGGATPAAGNAFGGAAPAGNAFEQVSAPIASRRVPFGASPGEWLTLAVVLETVVTTAATQRCGMSDNDCVCGV